MKLNFENNLPIYVQIVDKIKIMIISGELKIGERLPSVRDLALITKVNPNTMQKALTELETLGLIYTERTNGKFVTLDEAIIEKYRNEYVEESINDFLEKMKSMNIDKSEIIKILNNNKEEQ